MLKIQVLGKGMIPRGYGLAPRKEFFKADLTLIHTILQCPNLKVNMLNPETNKIMPVTKSNVKTLWDKYRSDRVVTTRPIPVVSRVVENVAPEHKEVVATPTSAPEVKNEEPKVEEVKEEVKVEEETKEVEKKDEVSTPAPIKPVMNDNKNHNNNNNHNNHNNNKK